MYMSQAWAEIYEQSQSEQVNMPHLDWAQPINMHTYGLNYTFVKFWAIFSCNLLNVKSRNLVLLLKNLLKISWHCYIICNNMKTYQIVIAFIYFLNFIKLCLDRAQGMLGLTSFTMYTPSLKFNLGSLLKWPKLNKDEFV